MQQIKCARSLLTCWPSTVQRFSPATSLVMNPLQGKPFVLGYDQRKSEHGMRPLACASGPVIDALNCLEELIIPDQESEQPILYDGSTLKQVDIDMLEGKNLFLLFSKLNIPEPVINSLKPVHEKLQEQNVIVWIPVEYEQWDQKTFEDYSRKMPWYKIKCFPSKDIIESKWEFKGNPMLTVMNQCGKVDHRDALQLIKKKGVNAFLKALHKSNSNNFPIF